MARIDADDIRRVEIALNSGGRVVKAHGAAGATETVDLDDGSIHTVTLDANCTFTFTAAGEDLADDGYQFFLYCTQDATGSRLVTWPASVKWPAATAPTLTTTAAKTDVFRFITADGGTTWVGSTVGLNYTL